MSLYRASPQDGVAWVTGASTGIGRALALELARKGFTVAITAREREELANAAAQAEGLSGRLVSFPCDVTDEDGMARTVAAIEKQLGAIVLAVLNAGTFLPTRGERLETTNIVRTFEVNVFGVVFGLVPVVDCMRARGYGQVALMGSVTSYVGLPSAAGYGASKAAINNMAQGLRFDFEKMNIRIQVFNPGFVATPLTARNRFRMPALMQVENAAGRVARGLESGGFEISFPRRFTWWIKFLQLFPQDLIHFVLNRLTGWPKRPLGPQGRNR